MAGVGSGAVKSMVLLLFALKQHRQIHRMENRFFYFLEEEYNPDALDKKKMRSIIGKDVQIDTNATQYTIWI